MSIIATSTLVPPSNPKRSTASDSGRRCADYHPSLWKDHFLQYASESLEADDEMGKHIEALKEEVRKMLVSSTEKPLMKLKLIDSIQCLGLSYHFETEIEEVLQQIHNGYIENNEILTHNEDLHSLALLFKLLRQQGYHVSPDVFNKFKDEKGNFGEALTSDVEGMLSLYEASHVSIHGEDILDEALVFTSDHLRSITVESNPFLAAKVNHSLRQSPYRGLPRLEARKYISIYHLHPSCNKVLLTLAKLDFNMLQKLHQKEVGSICKWWNSLDVSRNFSYVRNRIVECFLMNLGVYFEPQYSKGRSIMSRLIGMITIIDDTYDAYGTIDELEVLTEAVERWDICCLDNLPDYMKLIYKELLSMFEEIDQNLRNEGRSYDVQYMKQEFKKVVQGYMSEARWLNRNYIPTTEEYMNVAKITGGCSLLSTTSFVGMEHIATEDIFKWVQSDPKILKACSLIMRHMDDIVSGKKRGHVASAVECYMKEHGMSRTEAIDELEKIIKSAWKDINEGCLRRTQQIPMPFLVRVLNLCRYMDVMYKDADNYTHSEGIMKDSITLLLVDPVPM